MAEHQMKEIRIAKVTANIGAGEVGEEVERAVNLLETLTGKEAVRTTSGDAAKGFGLRDGLNIGAKVTLRGDDAQEFLERVLAAKGNTIPARVFDTQGNFSLGVEEYIDMPGITYDPDIGMRGFEIAVTLERPGERVKKRDDAKPLGKDHQITAEDAREFVQETFDVEVTA